MWDVATLGIERFLGGSMDHEEKRQAISKIIREAAVAELRRRRVISLYSEGIFSGTGIKIEETLERDNALRSTEFGFYVTISDLDLREWEPKEGTMA